MSQPAPDNLLDPGLLAALNRLSLTTRRLRRGHLLGTRRSLRHGASVEFSDYRDYAAGDDLRTIDWRAYARLEKLLVKLFRDEDDLSLHLMLDASLSMSFGAQPDKMLFAKQLCAALGAVALLDFDRCSLSVLSEEAGRPGALRSHALRGRSALPALLAQLARVRAGGQARLASIFAAVLQQGTSPGALVIVSDFYDHGLTPALLARAGKTLDIALVHIAAPQELEPSLLLMGEGQQNSAVEVRLIDSETGESVETTLAPDAMKRYQLEFEQFCADLSTIARAGGASYTRVSTDTALEEVVLGALRRQRVVA